MAWGATSSHPSRATIWGTSDGGGGLSPVSAARTSPASPDLRLATIVRIGSTVSGPVGTLGAGIARLTVIVRFRMADRSMWAMDSRVRRVVLSVRSQRSTPAAPSRRRPDSSLT